MFRKSDKMFENKNFIRRLLKYYILNINHGAKTRERERGDRSSFI